MVKFALLTLPVREVIENMHADGYVQEAIAAAVGVDQSTVSRDLRRRPGACILRSVRATVPPSGEPLFRGGLSHCDVAD